MTTLEILRRQRQSISKLIEHVQKREIEHVQNAEIEHVQNPVQTLIGLSELDEVKNFLTDIPDDEIWWYDKSGALRKSKLVDAVEEITGRKMKLKGRKKE